MNNNYPFLLKGILFIKNVIEMATDFNYNNKTIVASGPFKPSGKNMPVKVKTLKANTIGVANSVIDEVERYVNYG